MSLATEVSCIVYDSAVQAIDYENKNEVTDLIQAIRPNSINEDPTQAFMDGYRFAMQRAKETVQELKRRVLSV